MDVDQRELSTKWNLTPGNIQHSTVGLENNVLTLFSSGQNAEFTKWPFYT